MNEEKLRNLAESFSDLFPTNTMEAIKNHLKKKRERDNKQREKEGKPTSGKCINNCGEIGHNLLVINTPMPTLMPMIITDDMRLTPMGYVVDKKIDVFICDKCEKEKFGDWEAELEQYIIEYKNSEDCPYEIK